MYIEPKRVIRWSFIVGCALFIFSGWLWWAKVYQSPQTVFWGAIANNLATTSVTKHTVQQTNGSTIDQYGELILGEKPQSHWLTTIRQANAHVVTESIGTPAEGFVRYTNIQTTQRNKQGKPLDFSHVLNVWGKATPKDNSSLTGLFDQTLIDISTTPTLPIGNLAATQRATLVDYMKKNNVFTTTYTDVQYQTVNGQEAYVYSVKVALEPYLKMMQQFARDEGVNVLNALDPTHYQNAEPVTIDLAISPSSHQVLRLAYTAQGFQEDYSAYNVHTDQPLPAHTIPVAELQSRIQTLQ
ncbi:MAG TPA: hypothetical protein VHD60_03800 [Candidatus Saccharimonadales bacterium]|nr:hypothetical protein [Candidatus Saccharimonadales bacterium]